MNDDLQQRLTTLLDYIGTRAKDGEGFLLEQAPLVCREIVAWTFWSSVVCVALGLLFLLCGMAASLQLWRNGREWMEGDEPPFKAGGLFVALMVGFIGGFGILSTSVGPLIKSCAAPRLVILDYVKAAAK